MKTIFAFAVCFTAVCFTSNARVWRVNNTPGVVADFTDMPAAMASSSVVNDDTIYVEGSGTNYSTFLLTKRLTIIGTGYFLSGANSNTGLQNNPNASTIATVYIDTLSSGSKLMGLNFSNSVASNNPGNSGGGTAQGADNITISSFRIGSTLVLGFGSPFAGADYTGWIINKCYVVNSANMSARPLKNCEFTNCIFSLVFDLSNAGNINNLVRNNVFRSSINLQNNYFSNNIITGNTFTSINTTIRNNSCIGAAAAGFALFVGSNGNVDAQTDANIFQGLAGNSTDGQWRLKAGSQAIGTGETVSGITPDRGAFGTADPYILSGIPPIPTIYALTVPASVATSATTMPITISTKSN
jgi:hypothetical protein